MQKIIQSPISGCSFATLLRPLRCQTRRPNLKAVTDVCVFVSLACVMGLPLSAHAEETSLGEAERPFRLMRLEEAYTQERGEWQFRLQTEYLERTQKETEETGPTTLEKSTADIRTVLSTLSIEYGITDQLEFDLSLPVVLFQNTEGRTREFDTGVLTSSQNFDFDDSGLGDIELGLALALLEEHDDDDRTSLLPALTLELGVSAPTGDKSDEFGAGKVIGHGGVAMTKSLGPFYATGNFEFGIAKDLREFEYGFGLLHLLGESGWGVAIELEGETEKVLDETESERALHVIPSASFGWSDAADRRWQIGVGVPIGLTQVADESDKIGALLQMQVEF